MKQVLRDTKIQKANDKRRQNNWTRHGNFD